MSSDMFDALSVHRKTPRYNEWLYSRIQQHLRGTVLDIGSGLGNIAWQFKDPGVEEVIFSDYDPMMLGALGDTTFPLKKYRVIPLDISNPQSVSSHPSNIADTITCINVLEHIENDVDALKHMKYLLKEGGKVVIFVPAFPRLYGTLDSMVDHYRRYTPKTLKTAFHNAGLKVKDCYYMNMFGIVTWFLAGRVLKQRKLHQPSCCMLDKIVPILKNLESLGSPPFGQSLIMVAESS